MKMSILSPATSRLVFNWDAPRRRNLAIAGFLTASFIAHAACFYIFQVVYPPTIALLPPPARVNLITAASEEGRTLLRWIEAEDPALASTTRRPPDARAYALPNLQHVPSYFATEPALKEAPPVVVDLRTPSSRPPGPVPMMHRQATRPVGVASTSVAFSKEMEGLGAPQFPRSKFSASTNEPPQSVRFRIAVNRGGEVRYCFALNSSGDPALDEQARNYLALSRFPPKATPNDELLVWGIATVEWGNDVARLRPTSTSAPTP
jgi:hypothetical protein